MIKNIFFDFDGVLCESENVKGEAFYQLYLPYGKEVASKVLQHHLTHGGVSRYEKIRYYHKQFLCKDISDTEVNEMAQRFSDMVVQAVINAPEAPGATNFLQSKSKDYNCYIITATPTEEMKLILDNRGWAQYFKEVCGSPNKKDYWAAQLLARDKLNKAETVFVGDAPADKNAADKNNITFILRHTKANTNLFLNYDGLSINDINNLLPVLHKLDESQ